ncbi:MAG: diguanylate cyclase, partial [Planctomycetales bacterium]|nr:diguanylate cyclase [Planctomycetales bacterium]
MSIAESTDALQFQAASDVGPSPHGVSLFDRDGYLLLGNQRFMELYGLNAQNVPPGTHCRELLGEIAREDVRDLFGNALASKPGLSTTQQYWQADDGRFVAITCETLPGGGCAILHEVVYRHGVVDAVAETKKRDALTDLLDRRAFESELESRLVNLCDLGEMAMLSIGLDHFKPVNDTLGHKIGDQVLREVAKRLRQIAKPNDLLGRLGGDEFAILQTGGQQPEDASRMASQLNKSLSDPIVVDGHTVNLGASIGIAL